MENIYDFSALKIQLFMRLNTGRFVIALALIWVNSSEFPSWQPDFAALFRYFCKTASFYPLSLITFFRIDIQYSRKYDCVLKKYTFL